MAEITGNGLFDGVPALCYIDLPRGEFSAATFFCETCQPFL